MVKSLIVDPAERLQTEFGVSAELIDARSLVPFDYAPVVAVGAKNWITPAAELEELFFPQPGGLLDAIHAHLLRLPGYRPSGDWSLEARLRDARAGV